MASALDRGLDSFNTAMSERRKNRTLQQNADLDRTLKMAELQSKGFQVQEQQTPRKLFGFIPAGNQRSLSITENKKPLPPGFVEVNGKAEKDPAYLNPLEKSRVGYYQNMSGGFPSGGTTPDGDPIIQKTPQERMGMLSPEDQAFVKGLTDYTIDPASQSSRGNKRGMLVGLAKEVDPSYDQMQYKTRSDYRNEFSKGKIGANVRSFNTAIQHLAELNDASQKTPSNPIQPIEAGQRILTQKLAGDSPEALAMQSENSALTAVSGELANIFKNSGGTDQEIEKWFRAYNPNATRAAKQQFIKTGIELMKGRVGSLDADYERVMGKKNTNPLISKESEAAMQRIGGGQGRSFNSPEEADASGLPAGTVVSVQGRKYQI